LFVIFARESTRGGGWVLCLGARSRYGLLLVGGVEKGTKSRGEGRRFMGNYLGYWGMTANAQELKVEWGGIISLLSRMGGCSWSSAEVKESCETGRLPTGLIVYKKKKRFDHK